MHVLMLSFSGAAWLDHQHPARIDFLCQLPKVCPAVSLKLVLYFTLNAAGSQNYAHCSLLFLALRFPHLPTKICSPSENGLYFLCARKPLSHGVALLLVVTLQSGAAWGRALPPAPLTDPSLQPCLCGKCLSCLVAAGFVDPPIAVSFIYCLFYAREAKFWGVVARNYQCVHIYLL